MSISKYKIQSRIDLDLQDMKELMQKGDFDQAYQIFRLGAHAEPYAILRLEEVLTRDFQATKSRSTNHLVAYGMDQNNQVVPLRVSASSRKGTSTVYVMYQNDTNCHVGGRRSPVTNGCLASKGGLIVEDYGALNYHYDIDSDNQFRSSLYGFSEHEAETMFHCHDKCPFPEYEKFYHYYGQLDYGAVWMTAALKGHSTSVGGMSFHHGSEDFGQLSDDGRRRAVETAAVTMNVRTHVNRIMTEWAVDACRKCSDKHCPEIIQGWDLAVAQYTGGLVQPILDQPQGYESGLLFYGLADELCQDFSTCGINGDDVEGTSAINRNMMQHFQSGRIFLEKNVCDMADLSYGQIVHLMTVPLIQGTLRSAYRLQYTHQGDQEEKGRGVAFMASILPDLFSCSSSDADLVYNELNLSSGKIPDFQKIKAAFERNYMCLSVSCEDVGGLLDESGETYVDGGNPCGSRRARQRRGSARRRNDTLGGFSSTPIHFLVLGSAGFVAIALTMFRSRWIPAVSSRVDFAFSKLSGERTRYHPVEGYQFSLHPRIHRDDSSATYDQDHSISSTDYYEDGFDLTLSCREGMDVE